MEANRLHNNQGNLMHWPRSGLRICISHGPPDDCVAEPRKEANDFNRRKQAAARVGRQAALPTFLAAGWAPPRGEPELALPEPALPAFATAFRKYAPWHRECPPFGGRGKGWGLCTFSVAWLISTPQRVDVIPVDAEFGIEARDLHLGRPGPGEAVCSGVSAGAPARSPPPVVTPPAVPRRRVGRKGWIPTPPP